jgi:cell division protein FtsW (lipid II flippase)
LTEEEEQAQTARRTRPGRDLSPGVTLLLLTLFQSMLLASLTGSQLSEGTGTTLMICFGLVMGLQWLCYLLYRILRRTGFELETLAFFLSSLCLAVTAVSSPSTLPKQTACIPIGLGLYFVMNLVLRDLEWAKRLQRPLAFFSAGLLVFNLLFGTKLFGAQNWVVLGPISFQPSEFVKIVFILVGAATLDKLFNRKNLLGSLLFSVFCVGCLALMSDFGTALIFFVAFLAIAFLRSGDLASVLFMLAAAAMACMLVLQYKSYIAQRFAVYRHVWEDPSNYGYQQTRTMSAIASGGLFGRGLGNGWLKNLGAANTDLVFGVLGEELGLIIALCAVLSILLMVLFAIRQAATARSSFYVICGCATGMLFLVQTMLNVFGSVDLLPLTGVTLPFVSVGGSSMISCWGLLAFLKASDTRQNASLVLRLPRRKRKRGAAAPSADAVPFARSAPTQDSPDASDIAQETRVIHHLGTYPAPEEATRVPYAKGTASSSADEAPPEIPTPPAAGDSDADNWQQYFQWEEDDP